MAPGPISQLGRLYFSARPNPDGLAQHPLLLCGCRAPPPDTTTFAPIYESRTLSLCVSQENAPGLRLAQLEEHIQKFWPEVACRPSLLRKEQFAILAADRPY
jgi:hypothetical protein